MSSKSNGSHIVASLLGLLFKVIVWMQITVFKALWLCVLHFAKGILKLADLVTEYRKKKAAANEAAKVLSRSQQTSTAPMAVQPQRVVPVVDLTERDFPPTVVMNAPGKGDFIVSDRIKVVPVMAASDVQLGRITFYLYPNTGKVRRVFRVDMEYIQKLLGTERYFMTDVPWNVVAGESDLERISTDSAREIVDLIDRRLSQFNAAKNRASRKAQAAAIGFPANAANPIRPTSQESAASGVQATPTGLKSEQPQACNNAAQFEQPQTNPHVAKGGPVEQKVDQVANAVERPTVGQRYVGFVVEAGPVDRNGIDGRYRTFCLKLEVNGTHVPFYGVEIERELMERNVRVGYRIEVVFMGRTLVSPPGEKERFKNLYKVKVLKGN